MPMIDTYRNNIQRNRDELAKLSKDRANESSKIPPLNTKILSANNTISHTKSQSTIQSKLREISNAQKSLAEIDKKIANIDKKIAAKNQELINEEKRFRQEEEKEIKKHALDEKRRIDESTRQLNNMNISLQRQSQIQYSLSREIEILKYVPEKIVVLLFATNPKDTCQLRLDEEVRSIQEVIRKSEYRDSIVFETRWAVRPFDILQAINELNPDIVHFTGHGSKNSELLLENANGNTQYVSKEAITQTIMSSSEKIHFIFFDACFTDEQAISIIKYVDAAIGMTDSISDEGASAFAAQFYSSLGFGFSIKKAFEQAKGILASVSPSEIDIPTLYVREGVNPENFFLVQPNLIKNGLLTNILEADYLEKSIIPHQYLAMKIN
ncbi:MAG: hypothetical protein FWG07_02045 [Treponema sp.]|nr:hypothetical protein [Treponema sp.]